MSHLYRKRPIIVRVYQHTGPTPLVISTLEGDMRADPGDWIITGVNGEQYPCKPDVFAKTYEPVADDTVTPHRQHPRSGTGIGGDSMSDCRIELDLANDKSSNPGLTILDGSGNIIHVSTTWEATAKHLAFALQENAAHKAEIERLRRIESAHNELGETIKADLHDTLVEQYGISALTAEAQKAWRTRHDSTIEAAQDVKEKP